MKSLTHTETIIAGTWNYKNGTVVEDLNCKRIKYLVDNQLEHISTDNSGWSKLYFDGSSEQYWELSYPQSSSHGGGPPTLTRVEISARLLKLYEIESTVHNNTQKHMPGSG